MGEYTARQPLNKRCKELEQKDTNQDDNHFTSIVRMFSVKQFQNINEAQDYHYTSTLSFTPERQLIATNRLMERTVRMTRTKKTKKMMTLLKGVGRQFLTEKPNSKKNQPQQNKQLTHKEIQTPHHHLGKKFKKPMMPRKLQQRYKLMMINLYQSQGQQRYQRLKLAPPPPHKKPLQMTMKVQNNPLPANPLKNLLLSNENELPIHPR